jgi:hypothetical protein
MSADITQFVEFPPRMSRREIDDCGVRFAVPPLIGHNSWQRRAAMETQMSDNFMRNIGRKSNLWK